MQSFAAQPLAEADHTIEVAFELCFVIGAYQFAHRSTVSAVWRLISQPLCRQSAKHIGFFPVFYLCAGQRRLRGIERVQPRNETQVSLDAV